MSKVQNQGSVDPAILDQEFETVSNWSRSTSTRSRVWRPNSLPELRGMVKVASEQGLSVVPRGAGQSYGDAALLDGGVVLDTSRLNRVLEWDADNGVIRLEAGVTIDQLWRHVIGDGWWPPVVSGTSYVTLGGAAAMNIHGKNNWRQGTIGEHIEELEFLTAAGELMMLSRKSHPEIFHAVIGGFGVLGIIASLTLRLHRIFSGNLHVTPFACENLSAMFQAFRDHSGQSDYLVGWVDGFASGTRSGRGLVHAAEYIDADRVTGETRLSERDQVLPGNFLGVLPRDLAWVPMQILFQPFLMRQINRLKYWLGRQTSAKSYEQPHAQFAFLLDFFPGWQKAYGRGGMIQYQAFVPEESAEGVFSEQLALARESGLVPFLGVMKRHRADPFLMTHGLDGYSLALEFKVTRRNRPRLARLCTEFDHKVLAAGGRFYFAKDSMLSADSLGDYLAEPRVRDFLSLKATLDPRGVFDSDLFERIFGSKRKAHSATLPVR